MLFLLGVILAAAFFASEWNDVTERLTWTGLQEKAVRARWRRPLNMVANGTIATTGIARLIVAPWRSMDVLDWVILGIFVWSAMSIVWATDRRLTARSLGCWLSMGCAVFGIGLTGSLDEGVLVVATGCLFYFLVGVVHEFCTSRFSFSRSYRFFGAVGSNRQGAEALLMLFLILFLYQSGTIGMLVLTVVATYAMGVVLLSRSRTATWAALAAFLAWFFISLPSTRALAIAFGVLIAWAGVIGFIPLLRSRAWVMLNLGRKLAELKNFSGRTIIWRYLWPTIRERPILGTGYGSFWIDARHFELGKLHPFFIRISHAHSVYLDFLLNGGLVALLLFLSTLGIAVFNAVQTGPPTEPFVIALVTYAAIHGLGESTLALPLHRSFAFFSLLVACNG